MDADQPITLKPAKSTDAARLIRLIKRYYASDQIRFDARAVRAGLKQLLSRPMLGRAWFLRLGRRTIGYVVITFGFDFEFGGRLATITDLYLEPDHRGKGLGRQALSRLQHFCVTNGVCALELQVERHNRRAARLYQNFGFTALDRIPMV